MIDYHKIALEARVRADEIKKNEKKKKGQAWLSGVSLALCLFIVSAFLLPGRLSDWNKGMRLGQTDNSLSSADDGEKKDINLNEPEHLRDVVSLFLKEAERTVTDGCDGDIDLGEDAVQYHVKAAEEDADRDAARYTILLEHSGGENEEFAIYFDENTLYVNGYPQSLTEQEVQKVKIWITDLWEDENEN
ncbi:MAG: hypothetical protein HFE78_02660 [Clostridiales bacterium]|nr:hypothetical protein [Clostridiales bacterium]